MNDKKPQAKKFKEKAKELGADESEEAFERSLKRVAKKKKAPSNGT